MRLPPPRDDWYDTLSIEFNDGCIMNLPYFNREGSEYYLQKLSKKIKSFKVLMNPAAPPRLIAPEKT